MEPEFRTLSPEEKQRLKDYMMARNFPASVAEEMIDKLFGPEGIKQQEEAWKDFKAGRTCTLEELRERLRKGNNSDSSADDSRGR